MNVLGENYDIHNDSVKLFESSKIDLNCCELFRYTTKIVHYEIFNTKVLFSDEKNNL